MSRFKNEEIQEIEDPRFKDFLDNQKPKTKKVYASYFRRLLEYDPSLTGAQMLQDKEAWEMKRLLGFQRYLIDKCKYSQNYATSASAAVRGFFSANRRMLVFTNAEKRKMNERGNITDFFSFDRQNLTKLWNIADLKDKWVLSNKSFGLRAEDFARITFGHLRTLQLDAEAPVGLGEYLTLKEKVKAHPWLDTDVITVVKQLLEVNKEKADKDKVFPHVDQELNYRLQALVKKAKIETGSKKVSFHGLRRFCYTVLISNMGQDLANFIVGKLVKEKAYIITDAREAFTRAMPNLLILNGLNGDSKKKISTLEDDNARLSTVLNSLMGENMDLKRRMGLTEEKLGNIEKLISELKKEV